jgi:hypothetical protein
MRILMIIAGLTFGVGFLALLFAIVYRIMTMGDSPAASASGEGPAVVDLSGIGLPAGAELVSTALDGDRLALTFRTGDDFLLLVLDATDMSVISRATIPAP